MKQKTALLLGSYGQTNLGDDLLMWNYLSLLRLRGYKKIIVNASRTKNIPAIIKKEFPGLVVRLTYETSLTGWLRILKSVDCVVYGGGTVFKELYSTTGRGKYSVIIRVMVFNILARLLGLKIYNLHIGIGVLKTGIGRFITRTALVVSKLTVFRDKKSYKIAHETLSLPKNKISLATDGLFINNVWQKEWHKAELKLPKGKRVVGINLLSDIPDWINRELYIESVCQFIEGLLSAGSFVVLMPFQHDFNDNNDHAFMKREIVPRLASTDNCLLLPKIEIDQAVSVFKQIDIFVGMRFHSLLLATAANTPFVGLAYDTKCWRFLEDSKYPYGLKLEDLTIWSLDRTYQSLADNLLAAKTKLKSITAQQLKRGQECLDQLDF